jgi:uncharacterized protein YgiM (DUF1202 family)
MKRFVVIIFLGMAVAGGLAAQSFKGNTLYVAVKNTTVKSSSDFFSNIIGNLRLGDAVTVLQEKTNWVEIRSNTSPSVNGWVALSSLTSKRITSSNRSVSASELALAGKGFSADIEREYQTEGRLNYEGVNSMESYNIPAQELLDFLIEGRLKKGANP